MVNIIIPISLVLDNSITAVDLANLNFNKYKSDYDFSISDSVVSNNFPILDPSVLSYFRYYKNNTTGQIGFYLSHNDNIINALIKSINLIASYKTFNLDPLDTSGKNKNVINSSKLNYPLTNLLLDSNNNDITPTPGSLSILGHQSAYFSSLIFHDPTLNSKLSGFIDITQGNYNKNDPNFDYTTTLGRQFKSIIDNNRDSILEQIFYQIPLNRINAPNISFKPGENPDDRITLSDGRIVARVFDGNTASFPFQDGDTISFNISVSSVLEIKSSNTINYNNPSIGKLLQNRTDLDPYLVNTIANTNNKLTLKPKVWKITTVLKNKQKIISQPHIIILNDTLLNSTTHTPITQDINYIPNPNDKYKDLRINQNKDPVTTVDSHSDSSHGSNIVNSAVLLNNTFGLSKTVKGFAEILHILGILNSMFKAALQTIKEAVKSGINGTPAFHFSPSDIKTSYITGIFTSFITKIVNCIGQLFIPNVNANTVLLSLIKIFCEMLILLSNIISTLISPQLIINNGADPALLLPFYLSELIFLLTSPEPVMEALFAIQFAGLVAQIIEEECDTGKIDLANSGFGCPDPTEIAGMAQQISNDIIDLPNSNPVIVFINSLIVGTDILDFVLFLAHGGDWNILAWIAGLVDKGLRDAATALLPLGICFKDGVINFGNDLGTREFYIDILKKIGDLDVGTLLNLKAIGIPINVGNVKLQDLINTNGVYTIKYLLPYGVYFKDGVLTLSYVVVNGVLNTIDSLGSEKFYRNVLDQITNLDVGTLLNLRAIGIPISFGKVTLQDLISNTGVIAKTEDAVKFIEGAAYQVKDGVISFIGDAGGTATNIINDIGNALGI